MAETYPVTNITFPFPVELEYDRIIKIPIKGPGPYNFIAVISHQESYFGIVLEDDIKRRSFVHRTAYRIASSNTKMPLSCKHSTFTDFKYFTFPADNSFLVAVDSLEGFFDEAGYFCLKYYVAAASDINDTIGGGYDVPISFKSTSFLLVVE